MKEVGKFIIIFASVLIAMHYGETIKQDEIEDRALKIEKKECYTWQDIETIVHGENQE